MKKYIATLAIVGFLAACGGNASDANKDSSASAQASAGSTDISQNPDYQKGLALIGNSDCLTCHKVSEKLVGPAYAEVADKYAGSDTAVTYLAHKVILGGKGNWESETNNAAMTPHPQISEGDAEQMVKYILLLKTK